MILNTFVISTQLICLTLLLFFVDFGFVVLFHFVLMPAKTLHTRVQTVNTWLENTVDLDNVRPVSYK